MTDTPALEVKKTKYSSRLKKRALFYTCIVAPFMIQFAIFYFYVNIETFVLAFQKYVMVSPGKPYKILFAGTENFAVAFDWLISNSHYYLNTLKFYFFELVIGFTLALLFSYYLYKRLPGHSMFKYFLFVPHILSGLLLVILYTFIVEDAYKAVCQNWFGMTEVYGLLSGNQPTAVRFTTIVVFVIWLSFGTKVLVYTGTMESIDPSMVESANLDGVNILQEFWFITMPMIWTTFMTFFITMLAGVFTNQMSLFTFYASAAPDDISNIGYKLYISTLNANLAESSNTKFLNYPALSAVGLIITAVLTPITLGVRKIMIKFGPNAG